MKQKVITIKDTSHNMIEGQLNQIIESGFYIKQVQQLIKTTFLVIVESEDINACECKLKKLKSPKEV